MPSSSHNPAIRPNRLRLFNTRTRRVEPFAPLEGDSVRIYVCGLTPSAEAHLGHARSFMFFDVLRRYLVHLGYRVLYVMNVTDIDDRSIAAAAATGRLWSDVVEEHFASFKRSMTRLRVLEPDREPRATEFVPQIVEMIDGLIAKGHAYAVADGVYYKVKSFPRYGALSGRDPDELMAGARIAPDEHKEDPLDFALWKFRKPGEPSWDSPWGAGRPGWHIECSAMSHALLREPFDIHGGGWDLVFPHHENEVAQSEALLPPGTAMVNFWVHGGLLQFDGRKMSKSLGNFEPLKDLLERRDAQAIRLLFLQTGYRKPMNFTEESLDGAESGLRRLLGAYDLLAEAPAVTEDGGVPQALEEFAQRFYAALDDDMNTSGAVSVLFDLAAEAAALRERGWASPAAAFMHEKMALLGVSPSERSAAFAPVRIETRVVVFAPKFAYAGTGEVREDALEVASPSNAGARLPHDLARRLSEAVGGALDFSGLTAAEVVDAAIAARQRAKSVRDFAQADRLRDALAAAGVALKDRKNGVEWSVAG